ncbi:hypothetical protein [Aeoliella mucimassa]|uniref:Uncharacterized protein n=1 Tax=Aeoliella mucimassa TaxID=2527972 RepID=A0A518AJV1_9BACT|nr:hypothetical protein [Aeoliella mucimassa]QDU55008.1 hypothetical protein Pan181_11930 [Aeoliella mucimassa]
MHSWRHAILVSIAALGCVVILAVRAVAEEPAAGEPPLDKEQEQIERYFESARTKVGLFYKYLDKASSMSRLAARRMGIQRRCDLFMLPGVFELNRRVNTNSQECSAEVQKAVLKLFPPTGGTWHDVRTAVRHAQDLAASLYKRKLDPCAYIEKLREAHQASHLETLCLLFYYEQLYLDGHEEKAIDLLTQELNANVESMLPASYLSKPLLRDSLERIIDKPEKDSAFAMAPQLLGVVGDAESLSIFESTRKRYDYPPRGYEEAIEVLKYRFQLQAPEERAKWDEQELLFYQIEILEDMSVGGDCQEDYLLAGVLRARFHGTEFSNAFLYHKLPDPVAITYLGIQGDLESIPRLEQLYKTPGIPPKLIDWSINTIKDGGIPTQGF